MSSRKPLIGILADQPLLGGHDFPGAGRCVAETYIGAIAQGAAAVPISIPALGEALAPADLLADFDAILRTGSPSNIASNSEEQQREPQGEAA